MSILVSSERSLFARPPKIRKTEEMQRLQLLQKHFELEELLEALGKPDEFLVAKKGLEDDLKGFIADRTLKTALKTLVGKIRPLCQVYLPQKDGAHLADMLGSIDKISKQLPPNGSQKIRDGLASLKTLYQQDQKRDPASYRASLQGLTTSFRYISQEVLDRILPVDAKGIVVKSKAGAQGGTRAVNNSGKLFCKNDPEAPSHQEGWNRFLQIFFKIHTAASQFARVHRTDGKEDRAYDTQFSLDVESDISLAKVVTEQPHLLNKMNDFLYGMHAISHIVGGPQDASENNFGVRLKKDKEGNIVDVEPLGFDDDRWGVLLPCRGGRDSEGKEVHFNNMRSIFLTMKKVDQPIDPRVRDHFKEMNPACATLQFLQEMAEYNRQLGELQRKENIPMEKMQEMSLPFLMLKEMIPTIYERFCKIREFMRTLPDKSPPDKSYMDLWKEVYPPLAYFYDSINKSYEDRYEAFLKIFVRGGPVYEEKMKDMLKRPLYQNMPLSDYLKTCTHGADDYEALRDTPPELAAEQWLQHNLDFGIYSADEQKEILKVLKSTPLSHITLRNCSVITESKIRSLLRGHPHLKKLTLIGCHRLKDEALKAIFRAHPNLELVICNCPGLTPEGFSSWKSKKISVVDCHNIPVPVHQPSVDPAAEQGFQKLSAALKSKDWKLIKEHYDALEALGSGPKAAILIVDSVRTTDQMRIIVKSNHIDALEFLKRIDFQLSLKNIKDECFFHLCCEEGNPDMLKWLCQQKIGWDEVVNSKGVTPAHVAVLKENLACLQILKEANAPIHQQDKARVSPLRLALERAAAVQPVSGRDPLAIAKWLINNGAPLDETNWRKQTLMHLVCQNGSCEILDLLLQKANTLAACADDNGRTPLSYTIEFDREACFDKILPEMKTVHMADSKGNTPLMQAAQLERPKMVTELLKRGAKTEEHNQEKMNAFQIAASTGSIRSLIILLGVKPVPKEIDVVKEDGKTLLHLAALSGNVEMVKWICQCRPELLKKMDAEGMTAAHYAAQAGNWEVFSALLNAGFPIDFQENAKRETCLMLALRGHHYEMANKMIGCKASLEALDHRKRTLIHRAAIDNDADLIRHLVTKLKIAVNKSGADNDNTRPLHLAAAFGRLAAIEALLGLEAERNIRTRNGKTPLQQAVMNGHEEAVLLLIKHGADTSATMDDGYTLLHYAAWYGHPKIVSLLLSLQPTLIHCKIGKEGHTPLHRAMYQRIDQFEGPPDEKERIRQRQIEVVRILLRFGAEVDARDNGDFTPLHLAGRWGRPDFARILLSRGASVYARYDKSKFDPSDPGKRTPEEHCIYMLGITEKTLIEGTKETAKVLKDHKKSLEEPLKSHFVKKDSLLSHEIALGDLLRKPLEERKTILLQNLKSDGGFRPDSMMLLRSIEEQLFQHPDQESARFMQQFQEFLKPALPREPNAHSLTARIDRPLTTQQIRERWLIMQNVGEFAWIIPSLGNPAETLQKLADLAETNPPLSEGQFKALCALIANLRGHEAWTAADFPKEICQRLSKSIGKFKKEYKEAVATAKEFLDDAASTFAKPHVSTDWKRKGIPDRRLKLLGELSDLFSKGHSAKSTLVDRTTCSLMAFHKDLFQQVRSSDFRLSEASSKDNPLLELERSSKDLTANCLILLLSGDHESLSQRLAMMIEWTSKSVLYGDFHQAQALFSALSHPAVTRVKKAYDRLDSPSRNRLLLLEKLFSPEGDYRNYCDCLRHRLSPSIPAFTIHSRLLTKRDTPEERYVLFRNLQEQRAFAARFTLPPVNPASESLIFLTSEMYQEYAPKKEGSQPAEDYAWERSNLLKPPKGLPQPGLASSLKKMVKV